MKERELYEDEVTDKQQEAPSMSVPSFKVSIDRSLLKTKHSLEPLESVAKGVSFGDRIWRHIEEYIRGIVNSSEKKFVSTVVIREALKGVRMPMSVADPEAGVL